MTSVILMAGYSNRREVKRYSKIVAEHYGEKFIESGYKPLREFTVVRHGKEVRKPVIQFILEKLYQSELIGEIVIVGHRMLLEQSLGTFIREHEKPCRIVNQNARIPQDAIQQFNIIPKRTKYASLAGNFIKGYTASEAYHTRQHALFVAADSPLTTLEFIEDFLHLVEDYQRQTAIIVPGVLINDEQDQLGRKPLKLLNDTGCVLPERKDIYDRYGFRLSSLIAANPYQFNVNTINTAYGIRKFLSPRNQFLLFKITRSLGYANVYSKYFVRKDLSVGECEAIASSFFQGTLKIIPMRGEGATYDYDGTDEEYRQVSDLLKQAEKQG